MRINPNFFLFLLQLSEEITGHVPTDDKSIEEEISWIHYQLTVSEMSPFFGKMHLIGEINREDIGNVLGMLHVQKFDVSFVLLFMLQKQVDIRHLSLSLASCFNFLLPIVDSFYCYVSEGAMP